MGRKRSMHLTDILHGEKIFSIVQYPRTTLVHVNMYLVESPFSSKS